MCMDADFDRMSGTCISEYSVRSVMRELSIDSKKELAQAQADNINLIKRIKILEAGTECLNKIISDNGYD